VSPVRLEAAGAAPPASLPGTGGTSPVAGGGEDAVIADIPPFSGTGAGASAVQRRQ
jgi:hypothetical protein